jgi:hypothetical protein
MENAGMARRSAFITRNSYLIFYETIVTERTRFPEIPLIDTLNPPPRTLRPARLDRRPLRLPVPNPCGRVAFLHLFMFAPLRGRGRLKHLR